MKFPVDKEIRTCMSVRPGRQRNMAANKASSDSVVVLPYKDDGNEVRTRILESVPCEDDEGAKK